MDLSHFPSGAVGGVAAGVITAWLFKSARPAARADGDAMVVEYGRPMKALAVASWLAVAGMAVEVVMTWPRDHVTAMVATGMIFLMTLALHLEFFRVSIRYDAEGLHLSSPWRRRRFVPWSAIAITEAAYSQVNQWYVFPTSGHGKVRLSFMLSGLNSLLEEMERRGIGIPEALGRRRGS